MSTVIVQSGAMVGNRQKFNAFSRTFRYHFVNGAVCMRAGDGMGMYLCCNLTLQFVPLASC